MAGAIGAVGVFGAGTASADGGYESTVEWKGHGDEHLEDCHVGATEIHWVLTPGGGVIDGAEVMVGGEGDGEEMDNPGRNNRGAWHLYTEHDPGVSVEDLEGTKANFDGGTDNTQLVISGAECAYLKGFQIDLFRDDDKGAIETTFEDGLDTSYNQQDGRLVRSWWSTDEGGYQEDYNGTYTEPFDLGAIGFDLDDDVATVTLDLSDVSADGEDYGLASYDADGHSWEETNGFDRQVLYDYDVDPDKDDDVFTFTVDVPVGPGYGD